MKRTATGKNKNHKPGLCSMNNVGRIRIRLRAISFLLIIAAVVGWSEGCKPKDQESNDWLKRRYVYEYDVYAELTEPPIWMARPPTLDEILKAKAAAFKYFMHLRGSPRSHLTKEAQSSALARAEMFVTMIGRDRCRVVLITQVPMTDADHAKVKRMISAIHDIMQSTWKGTSSEEEFTKRVEKDFGSISNR